MKIFRRKIYSQLLDWKQNRSDSALLVEGARRIGKSFIVETFAKNEYKSHLLIDFNNASSVVKGWFDEYLGDIDTLLQNLQIEYGVKLTPHESCIVFDEVQMCPRARAAIKYLVADGRFHYIETGSLVSIKKNVKDITIPSEEMAIEMNPMDFEEFLWSMGEDLLVERIKECCEKKEPMEGLHRKAMNLFRDYMIVGGMPQALLKYVETKDYDKADAAKRAILSVYRNDIAKYATGSELKAQSIFDEIPAMLQRGEKKFSPSAIKPGTSYRDYDNAFFWLSDSRIVNMCYGCTAPNIGLRLNMERTTLKCYMADTGLLISHAFDENGKTPVELYKALLRGSLEVNEGMLMENIVAQMLKARGNKLYFYSKSSREDPSERMEIDFLITKSSITSRHNIIPIEVKSTKKYTLTSLNKCVAKFGEYITTPTVLHTADLKVKEGITYLPLYMAPWM